MANHCILPGCCTARYSGWTRMNGVYILEVNLYPRRNKEWQTSLLDFCLKYRDKKDVIKLAKKRHAGICERHFGENDFKFFSDGSKRLIPGRMPTKNLPQKSHQSLTLTTLCEIRHTRSRRIPGRAEINKAQQCVVGGCSNVPNCRASVHLFPIGEKLKRKWTKFVQSTRSNFVAPSKHSTVCSAHFKENCFLPVFGWHKVAEGRSPKRKLRPGAIPTIRHPADVCHILNERDSSAIERRKKTKVERGEYCSVQNGTVLESGNDTPESRGTIIPVDEIPTSAVPASCLGGIHWKSVYKKETRPKRGPIQANLQPEFSRAHMEVILPEEDYSFALLHHDYIETMSESSKDNIVSKEMINETHYAEANESDSNPKTAKITKQVKDEPGSKTRQRKRGSLLLYSEKTKLERSLYRSHLKHVQMEKGTELLANDVQTCLCCSQADDDTPKQKFDSPPSTNSLKRPKRRRKRLSLYGGRTKLERNPPDKCLMKMQTATKPANSAVIKEDSVCNEVSNLSESLTLDVGEDTLHDENQLLQSMYSMQKSGTLCDFTIIVSSPRTQRQFSLLVHRLVFASVSNKIKNHIGNTLDATEYCNKLDAQRIIDFVYTGKMEGIEKLAQAAVKMLHCAAVFLEIPKCVAYLKAFKKVQNTSIAKIGVSASCILPPLSALNSALDVEVFDIAENIRIESVVSVAADATDTSPLVIRDHWILRGDVANP